MPRGYGLTEAVGTFFDRKDKALARRLGKKKEEREMMEKEESRAEKARQEAREIEESKQESLAKRLSAKESFLKETGYDPDVAMSKTPEGEKAREAIRQNKFFRSRSTEEAGKGKPKSKAPVMPSNLEEEKESPETDADTRAKEYLKRLKAKRK